MKGLKLNFLCNDVNKCLNIVLSHVVLIAMTTALSCLSGYPRLCNSYTGALQKSILQYFNIQVSFKDSDF